MRKELGFSLVEVALALAVVAFGFLAVVGLIPVGLTADRDSINDTRTSLIAADVAARIGTIVSPMAVDPTVSQSVNWYYDEKGLWLGTAYSSAFYRAHVTRAPLSAGTYPLNTDPATIKTDPLHTYSTRLLGVSVTISSPVNTQTGTVPATTRASVNYSFMTRVMPNPSP